MARKLAIKKLTASDLTIFEWHFRNRNAGNQKAINLNADVFVDIMFPAIDVAAKETDGRLPIDLWVAGPGFAPAINLQRKIIKAEGYKNWRLNGEFIVNPLDTPSRFNDLVVGDFAVLAFDGDIFPLTTMMVLVANALPADASLHHELASFLGNRSMVAIEPNQLERLAVAAGTANDHPLDVPHRGR